MRVLILMLCLIMPAVCRAEPPVAKIRLNTDGATFAPGDIVVCEPDQLPAETKVLWKVRPEKHPDGRPTAMGIDGGNRIVLSTRPGIYYIRLVVGNADGLDFSELDVIVGKVDPAPNPQPNPNPQPLPPQPPSFPDSKLGLSQAVYDAAKTITNAVEAKAVADAHRGIAAQIAAGTLTSKQQIVSSTLAANRVVLGERASVWAPVFNDAVPKKLAALETAGKLPDVKAIGAAWIEIAIGLEAIR